MKSGQTLKRKSPHLSMRAFICIKTDRLRQLRVLRDIICSQPDNQSGVVCPAVGLCIIAG